MNDQNKTKEELIQELVKLRKTVSKLEEANSNSQLIGQELNNVIEDRNAALKESNDQLIQEIVKRQQAVKALRVAKEKLLTVFAAVPGTVSWISSDLRYIEVNQQLANIFSMPREEFPGKYIGFLGISSEFNDFVEGFFASSDLETIGEVVSQIDGEYRNYLIIAQKYNQNKAAFVIGIDITERKQAEKNLLVSKEKLETVLEAVPGMVSWINSDLTYIEVNQKLADTFNLAPDEFVGKNIAFINKNYKFNSLIQDFFASPEQEITAEITSEYNNISQNYLIVARKYNHNQAAFVVGINITEHRQVELELGVAQEQFKTILEAVPGIVSWISSDLRYLGVNKHLAKTYNLPQEAFVGQNIGFLKSSEKFSTFMQQFFASSAQDAYEEISAWVNGTLRSYLIVCHKYAQGAAAFAVGIDISDRKHAEVALQEAEEKHVIKVLQHAAPAPSNCPVLLLRRARFP